MLPSQEESKCTEQSEKEPVSAQLLVNNTSEISHWTTQTSNPNHTPKTESNSETEKDSEDQAKLNAENSSLLFHPRLSSLVRYLIPLLLVGNIILYGFSMYFPGTRFGITIIVNGVKTKEIVIKELNLFNSVSEMWQANVYYLALMIAACSGVWPYVKLFFLSLIWIIPGKTLSSKVRGILIVCLDSLGKWSLIDCYVLVIIVAAFRFEVQQNFLGIQGDGNLIVTIDLGFYLFFIATFISLILTNIVVIFHRKAIQSCEYYNLDQFSEKKSICSDQKKSIRLGVIILVLCSWVLMMVGICTQCFQFNVKGLAAWVLGSKSKKSYSILSLGSELPTDAANNNHQSTVLIALSYFVFAVITPILFFIALIILWIYPMRLKLQVKIFKIAEILSGWAALDVVIAQILVALVEIPPFARFMVGDTCEFINKILDYLDVQKHIINLHGDDKCFDLSTQIQSGSWFLFCSAIQFLVILVILRWCQKILYDRIQQEYNKSLEIQPQEPSNSQVYSICTQ